VPPSRRRPHPSAGQAPPVRRPRVAGLRNRPADHTDDPERELSGTLDSDTPEDTTAAPESAEPTVVEDLDDLDADLDEDAHATVEDDVAGDVDGDFDEDQVDADDTPAPTPTTRRPAGKRRTAGVTRPEDLSAAEAGTKAERAPRAPVDPRRRAATQLSVAVVLVVVAVVLAGLAVWFRGEAADLESADHNTALTDSGTTSEVVGQLKSAIETTFSYNYTDLDSTQKAVDQSLSGKARCEYDQLFGQVKQQAPKQKIIMVTAVRDLALVRLDGDRAEALVFIDQSSTRADVNNSVAGEAQFSVQAHREGDHWKITEFNMFDQPLVNGKPAPKC
jgi:Mce-associated membrane protein